MWWSIFLAVIGVTGLYLTTQKNVLGFAIGVGVQILWVVYALATGQYGFILSALAYGAVNIIGLRKWTKDAKEEQARETDEIRFLYFTGVNPEYPPHYWELKTAYGNVVQQSLSYQDEMGAIKNAVAVFGDKLFDSNYIVIDTSPDILAKLRREYHTSREIHGSRQSYPAEAMRMSSLPPMPDPYHSMQPTRVHHNPRPVNWVTGD